MNGRLYRSTEDRVLAGVAGGMAAAYDLDPALVRLGWAVLIVLTGGLFLIVYVIMAVVVPPSPYGWTSAFSTATAGGPTPGMGPLDQTTTVPTGSTEPVGPPPAPTPGPTPASAPVPGMGPTPYQWPYGQRRRHDRSGAMVLGALLIVVGGFLLLQQLNPFFDMGRFWPVLVIVVGLALVATAVGRRTA